MEFSKYSQKFMIRNQIIILFFYQNGDAPANASRAKGVRVGLRESLLHYHHVRTVAVAAQDNADYDFENNYDKVPQWQKRKCRS